MLKQLFASLKPPLAKLELSSARAERSSGIYFGGAYLPEEAATSHFMIVGSTGSGKTLTLRMMMGSVLPSLLQRKDQNAVVFDVKQDAVPILHGIFGRVLRQANKSEEEIAAMLDERIILLNPFDSRCHEWDIAGDVRSPEIALQIATILIPEEDGQNRYFSDAARDLLAGVMNVFIQLAPGRWYLADLLYAMRAPQRLRLILSQTDFGRELIALHLDNDKTSANVISTARTRLIPYDVVAALWRHAGVNDRTISLTEFVKNQKNRVLVLGNHQVAQAPILASNRVIFQRLTELVLSQDESETRRNWFFLDEVRKLGRLEGLDDLMTNGRSKGASVVLGFQDVDGMRAVYGKEVAGEITSMPGSFGILRVSGVSTPQWASEVFGEQEVVEKLQGSSHGTAPFDVSSSVSTSEHIRERKLYLSSFFRMLPRPEKGKPLHGYFWSIFARNNQPYKAQILPVDISKMLLPLAENTPNFVPWPDDASKRLPAWDLSDYERLQIPIPSELPLTPAPETNSAAGKRILRQRTRDKPRAAEVGAEEMGADATDWTELGPP